jgi:hypothetical protein
MPVSAALPAWYYTTTMPTRLLLPLVAVMVIGFTAVAGCHRRRLDGGQDSRAAPPADTPASLRRLAAGLPEASPHRLDEAQALKLVELSLRCVDQEYPNKPSDVQQSDDELLPPRKLHPAFFGCFDWHSAVHGHWTMVRVLRAFPKLRVAGAIRRALDRHLSPERIAGEVAYFQAEHHKLFERPYGWAWLLRLAAELRDFDDPDARRWAAALEPLERLLVRRTIDYLQRLSLPVRAGTHYSTAFALSHIHDYAALRADNELLGAIERACRRFYLEDHGCPTDYEPSGEDFISPCLAEADLMRRVLPAAAYRRWLDRFLPPLTSPRFEPLLRPPEVRDRRDGKIGHLIGLSMQRAWTMRGVSRALADDDLRGRVLRALADLHRDEALRLMFDSGYGGTHWLASFAIFLLSDANQAAARSSR